ncbi:hypothetical protein ACQE98_15800 [Ornithinimicrobium sp. W1679]|uniref:WD40/YVTN/BNR-like repeat-containing protein n=1 Tax=Ornithinimicrobium sp. W1679 TaxID=3418770 RepID=UPI003CEF49B2
MRWRTWVPLGVLTVSVFALARVEVPDDLGTWAQGPLEGQVVLTLGAQDDGVLAGTRSGLFRLAARGTSHDLDVEPPVHALVADADGQLWAGTDQGAIRVGQAVGTLPDLTGAPVRALGRQGPDLLAGGDSGAWRVGEDGQWVRVWPVDGAEPASVGALIGTPAGILFSHPDGLALLHDDGRVEPVLPDVDVVALGSWPASGEVWVGTRGAPLLLVSDDDGLTWTSRSNGLGHNAIHAVAQDPADPTVLVAGGSGLADGTGNAGTQVSHDAGRTWEAEQDRLSNTHIFAVLATSEPLRLGLRLTGSAWGTTIPLPVTTTRWYAATNGAGVATLRPSMPALEAVASTSPYLRLAEPLLAGLILVSVVVAAYRHPSTIRTPAQRGPPGPTPSPGRTSHTGRSITDHDNRGENA